MNDLITILLACVLVVLFMLVIVFIIILVKCNLRRRNRSLMELEELNVKLDEMHSSKRHFRDSLISKLSELINAIHNTTK